MRRTFFLACLLTPVIATADDLTIVSKVSTNGGAAETAISYVSGDRLRIAQPQGDVIIDVKSGDMTVFDNKKKTYYVVTKDDLDAMAAKMKETMNSPEMKQVQEQMKNLPPEMKKRMEGAMAGMFAVDVEKAGTTRKVAGYECENWTVKIGEISKAEHCVTSEVQFPAQSWKAYRNYADSLKTMMGAMGPMGPNMEAISKQLAKMKGYPLATTTTTNVMGRETVVVNEVTSIKGGPIPASAWEIPAGFKEIDNPMMKAMQGR